MTPIATRLKEVRDRRGLSLRAFAEAIRESTGYEISHSAVRHYEKGRPPPADYVRAVSEAFGIDVRWLLAREDDDTPVSSLAVGDLRAQLQSPMERIPGADLEETASGRGSEPVDAEWEKTVREWASESPPSPLVLRSHHRSEELGVPKEAGRIRYHRVDEEQLQRLRTRHSDLLEAATPHLQWLSALLETVPHVVYLANPDGVILTCEGDDALAADWHLTPGHDWSEDRMGTNGAGTALEAERPIAVIGAEHYNRAFRNVTCLGVPVFDDEGELRGALDVATEKRYGRPPRLLPAVYVGWVIGRELS